MIGRNPDGVEFLRDDLPPNDLASAEAAGQWRLVQGYLGPDESVFLTVQSGSMLPSMPVGSRIEVGAAAGNGCRVGDVVVFRRGDRLVAHRLLFGWAAGPGGWFLQRGDGVSPVGFLRPREILGRVRGVHDTDGTVHGLVGIEAEWLARAAARRSLARFVLSLLTAPARKAKRWLTRNNTGSA